MMQRELTAIVVLGKILETANKMSDTTINSKKEEV
jgi:hypothetical protein